MIRTQISMTGEQAEGLRRLAAAREKSQAAVLRDALDLMLGNEARAVRIRRARAAIGGWSSDPATTSRDHDAAVVEAFGS